jgi:hypothetical protein
MQKPSFCAATIPFQTLLVVVLLLALEGLLLLCVPPIASDERERFHAIQGYMYNRLQKS